MCAECLFVRFVQDEDEDDDDDDDYDNGNDKSYGIQMGTCTICLLSIH